MDADPVCRRQGRAHSRHHQPRYRLSELEFALAKVGCTAIVTATAFKTSNYMEMLNTLLPELAKAAPGNLHAARLPQLRAVIQVGDPLSPGTIGFEEVTSMAGARHRDALETLAKTLQFDDAGGGLDAPHRPGMMVCGA